MARVTHQSTANGLAFGQFGSSFITGDGGNVDLTGSGTRYIAAVTFLEDTTLEEIQTIGGEVGSISSITVENDHDGTFGAAADATDITASHTFPKGLTIYGRWDYVELNGGSCICYFAPRG